MLRLVLSVIVSLIVSMQAFASSGVTLSNAVTPLLVPIPHTTE